MAPSMLLVELPVPAGREEEWNTWYNTVHVQEGLAAIEGAVAARRYRVMNDADNDIRYVVLYDFESHESLETYIGSSLLSDQWGVYAEMWGVPVVYRRRGLEPVLEITAENPL